MKSDFVLCVDVGNTRLKWGVCDLSDISFIETGFELNSAELLTDVFLSELESYKSMPVWVSMVASSDIREQLSGWFKRYWGVEVQYINAAFDTDKKLNAYKVKEDFGVDRWLALVAAQRRYHKNYCVLDAGTAVTVDLVGGDGKHCGGAIMPGKKLLLAALNKGTAGIGVDSNEIKPLMTSMASCTDDGVFSGVMLSLVGGVERVIKNIKTEHADMIFVLTGGDAELIEGAMRIGSDIDIKIEKNLVLEGVGVIAREKYA